MIQHSTSKLILSEVEHALCNVFTTIGTASSDDKRAQALAQFKSIGLPTHRLEQWHYSNLKRIWTHAAPIGHAHNIAAEPNSFHFINGALASVGALPAGVTYRSLRDVLRDGNEADLTALFDCAGADDPILALNLACGLEGVVIDVAAHTHSAPFIHIIHESRSSNFSAFPVCLIRCAEGAELSVVEHYKGSAQGAHTLSSLHIHMASHAKVSHFCDAASHDQLLIASLSLTLSDHAQCHSFGMISQGNFVRRQIFADVHAHAHLDLRGLTLGHAKHHADTTLIVNHLKPQSTSRELFKHILDDQAVGIYQGKVIVHSIAQKTDGGMKSHALLLSDTAVMNNKPELEIYADDVVCGHGATVAQINEDQLFYLMSRGIPKAQAQAMLIDAFAEEMLADIIHDDVRDMFAEHISAFMTGRAS